jgi:hypothetical protein
VEVGEEAVGCPKAIAGGDEDGGVAFERVDPAGLVRGAFEQPKGRGADRDDPAAGGARGVEAFGGSRRDAAPFLVHDMVVRVVGLDRKKGAGADMERQRFPKDAGLVERLDQARREMERGGGRGDGAFARGEHGLVIKKVAVVGAAPAGDVGRQRHPAGALEQELDWFLALELEEDVLAFFGNEGGDALAEIDPVAFAEAPGVADEGAPGAGADSLVEGRADSGLAAPALELGRDDPGVVEDENVAAAEEAREIEDGSVLEGVRADEEEAGGIARGCGAERDVLGREAEVEEVYAHG